MVKKQNFIGLFLATSLVFSFPVNATDYKNSTASEFTEDVAGYDTYGEDISQEKTAYSTEISQSSVGEYYDDEKVDVYATQSSNFSVIIPKIITLDGDLKLGNYQVAAKGDLTGGQKLKITTPETFELYEQGTDKKDSVTAEIYGAKTEWTYQDIRPDTYDGTGTTVGTVSASGISAGSWKGYFDFSIELEQSAPLSLTIGRDFILKVKSLVSPDATLASIDTTITKIEITNEAPPLGTTTVDLAGTGAGDGNFAIGYLDGTVVKIYSNLRKLPVNTDASYMFCNLQSLKTIDLTDFDFSRSTGGKCLFYQCSSLSDIDVTKLDTENMTVMSGMFAYCNSLKNLDLSRFDTSKVTKMDGMFCECAGLTSLDLSSFNTKNVTTFNSMFAYCTNLKNINLSHFNTEQATDMYAMFGDCRSVEELNLSSFCTKNATNMGYMFENCSSLTLLDFGPHYSVVKNPSVSRIFNNTKRTISIYAPADVASYLNTKQSLRTVIAKNY